MSCCTLADKKRRRLDGDEMLLCPYCVTFLLGSECVITVGDLSDPALKCAWLCLCVTVRVRLQWGIEGKVGWSEMLTVLLRHTSQR